MVSSWLVPRLFIVQLDIIHRTSLPEAGKEHLVISQPFLSNSSLVEDAQQPISQKSTKEVQMNENKQTMEEIPTKSLSTEKEESQEVPANTLWKWTGSIDYKQVTKACLKRLQNGAPSSSSSSYYVVYNVDSTVGFANQFRSLTGIFLIALVSGRRLRSRSSQFFVLWVVNWDDYYNVTSSAFTSLRYNKAECTI